MSYKTLHGWCRVKTNILDKLPAGAYDDKTDWAAAKNASDRTKKGDSPKKVNEIFSKWKKRGAQDHYLLQVHRRVRSGAYFIHNRAKLEKLDDKILRELRDNCQAIVNDVNGFFRGN